LVENIELQVIYYFFLVSGTGKAQNPHMFRYGKLARQAVSAMSYLAEKYSADGPSISSAEVGRMRKIPTALAAKLLSEAASVGLCKGVTGPGGGYRLARPPSEIRLADIVGIFEREMDEYPCPFGPGWCGTGNPCPLHNDFLKLETSGRKFLEETTLAVFSKKKKR
jgi:Rrf2 family transcriptional regulator, iron-sulfur cluster assembly transcription factor